MIYLVHFSGRYSRALLSGLLGPSVNFLIRAPHINIITVGIGGRTLLLAHFEFHHLKHKISSQDLGYDGEGIEKFNEQVILSGHSRIIRVWSG